MGPTPITSSTESLGSLDPRLLCLLHDLLAALPFRRAPFSVLTGRFEIRPEMSPEMSVIFILTSAVHFGILIKVLVIGEMSEWFMEPVLKTGDAERHRGFESLSLRQHSNILFYSYAEVPKWL